MNLDSVLLSLIRFKYKKNCIMLIKCTDHISVLHLNQRHDSVGINDL